MQYQPLRSKPQDEETTQDLLAAVEHGNREAWAALDLRYRAALRQVLRGKIPGDVRGMYDTEDLLQSAFLTAYRELNSFEYRGQGSFLAWLTRILNNRLQSRLREDHRDKRDVRRNQRMGTGMERLSALLTQRSPSEVYSTAEQSARVLDALGKLDPAMREVIQRHVIEQHSFRQIARDLSCDVKTARRRFARGIERLSSILS